MGKDTYIISCIVIGR